MRGELRKSGAVLELVVQRTGRVSRVSGHTLADKPNWTNT